MRLFSVFILVLLQCSLSFGQETRSLQPETPVLLNYENETVYATFSGYRERNGSTDLLFHQRRYLFRAGTDQENLGPFQRSRNYSPRNIRVSRDRAQYQTAINSTEVQIHNENVSLEAGNIVMTRNNRFFKIEAVFADGRIAAYELNYNPNGRDRIGHSRNFRVIEGRNIRIFSKDEIVAKEVRSFRGYSPGNRISEIEGIPVCDRSLVQEYNFEAHPANLNRDQFPLSGCRVGGQTSIGAVFSDGSLVFGRETIVNPFPTTIHRYAPRQEDVSQ